MSEDWQKDYCSVQLLVELSRQPEKKTRSSSSGLMILSNARQICAPQCVANLYFVDA